MTCFMRYPSPIGPLYLFSDGSALTQLRMETQAPDISGVERCDDLPIFDSVRKWLDAYFAGSPMPPDFPLSPAGTAFQQRVWQHLLTIPYGKTVSYGALAGQLGPGTSARAVGQAVGKNPIGIIIPCHRVIGAQGQLTGYAGGLDIKKQLLAHEEDAI